MQISLNTPLQLVQKTRTPDESGGWIETRSPPVTVWAFVKSLSPLINGGQQPKGFKAPPSTDHLRQERYEIFIRDTQPLETIIEVIWKNKVLIPLARPQPTSTLGYVSFQAVVLKEKNASEKFIVIRLATEGAQEQNLSTLPLWSAPGCTQKLTPCPQSTLHRTIDGRLVNLASPCHQKYLSTITCKDQRSLALEGLWVGIFLWIDCIQRLSCPLSPDIQSFTLARDPVEESIFLEKPGEEPVWLSASGRVVDLRSFPYPVGSFLSYRPRLLMGLKDFQVQTDEWGLAVGWTMELEEI